MPQIIDCSLAGFQLPGLDLLDPPFGVKKPSGVGLTTAEITRDIMMPFVKQRPISEGVSVIGDDPELGTITEDSFASPIEFNATFSVTNGIILQLDNPTFEGQKVVVAGSFEDGASTILLGFDSSGSVIPEEITVTAGNPVELVAVNGKWVRSGGGSGDTGPLHRYLAGFTLASEHIATVAQIDIDIQTGGEIPVNGAELHSGDIVLLTAQADKKENGLYTVSENTWTRTDNYTNGIYQPFDNKYFLIGDGVCKGKIFVIDVKKYAVDETELDFIESAFSPGTYPGKIVMRDKNGRIMDDTPELRELIRQTMFRVSLLEGAGSLGLILISFENLTGVNLERGVWNEEYQRVEC